MPAHDIEVEQAVIGAMMLEPKQIDDVLLYLPSGKYFYHYAHQSIYDAIVMLKNSNKYVDLLTVADKLKELDQLEEIGGPFFLTQLTNNVVSSAHIVSHCLIIKEKFLKRHIATLGQRMVSFGFDNTDVFANIDEIEQGMMELSADMSISDPISLGIALPDAIQDLARLRDLTTDFTGTHTGSTELDELTGGLQPGEVTVLGARPSTGKTAMVLGWLIAAAKHDDPCAFFSLEMPTKQIAKRILSITTGIANDHIKAPKTMTANKFNDMISLANSYLSLPIYIDDTPGLSLLQLKSKVRRLVAKKKVKLVAIDYLQLMGLPSGQNKNDGYGEITKSLKSLAKELDIHIIVLSQLSRDNAKLNRRPQAHDLRDSGAIEADADLIILLYHALDFEKKEAHILDKAVMANVCKHRNGRTDVIPYWPNWSNFTFSDTFTLYSDQGSSLTPIPTPKPQEPPTMQFEDDMPFK